MTDSGRPTDRRTGRVFFFLCVVTYLSPSLPEEHRPSTTPPPPPPPTTPPSHSVLGCSGHSSQAGSFLFQLCFSVSPPTVARSASLPLPLRVPGQSLACSAQCWLPGDVSDLTSLPPQYLTGHWFLSRSLPQIFISDLLLPLDFVDVPQTDVEECLDLLLQRLCCSPYLTSCKAGLTSHWS